jgi:uncharacterized protein GlcG (DUF336 family)
MQTDILALILKTILALSVKQGLNVSVAIYDQNCHLAAFTRMPDSYIGSIKSSQEKGRSACYFQRDTKDFEEAVNSGRIGILSGSDIVAISGGKAVDDHDLGKKALKALGYLSDVKKR